MLPDPELLPDVLPTDRLQQTGMPVPAVRADLRRISNARSAVTVVACLLQTFGVVRRSDVDRAVVGLRLCLPLDGTRPLPPQHPRPRSRAPTPLHLALAERRRRQVAARVPHVPGVHGLPPRALRASQGRDGPGRARPRPLRGLPDRERLDAAQAHPRPVLRVGLEEHEGTVAGGAGAQPRGLVHRGRAGSSVRHLHRRRPVVGLPSPLGRAVDDAVEAQQPPPSDRGARGHDAIDAIVASPRTSFVKAGSRG